MQVLSDWLRSLVRASIPINHAHEPHQRQRHLRSSHGRKASQRSSRGRRSSSRQRHRSLPERKPGRDYKPMARPVPASLDLGIGRTIHADFFDRSVVVSPKAKNALSIQLTNHPLRRYVAGAFSLPVFSASFCRLVTHRFYRHTTLAQRQTKGVTLCNSFYALGDAMARALDVYLPQLAADASHWFRLVRHRGERLPRQWRNLQRRWTTDGRFTADDKQLRFVEAVVIYYDRPVHPAIRMHTDDHDVTLNVCVGRPDFRGGELVLSCETLERLNSRREARSCGCHGGHGHVHAQKPGVGVVNLSVVPHRTRKMAAGERVNLVFKFVLVPRDRTASAAAERHFRHWPRLFTVLQRQVLGFLDARSLVYMAQTCRRLNTVEMCALPALWENLYAHNSFLTDFVSADELRSGQHTKRCVVVAEEQQLRHQVALVNHNWKAVYQQAYKHAVAVEHMQALRRSESISTSATHESYSTHSSTSESTSDSSAS